MKVDVTIESNCCFCKMSCELCAVEFKPGSAAANMRIDGESAGVVCEECLEAGIGGVRQRIRSGAESLRRGAEYLDSLAAADINLPSPADLVAAREQEFKRWRVLRPSSSNVSDFNDDIPF